MLYFTYNDFADCTENEELNKIIGVEERIVKYEQKNGESIKENKSEIISILRSKTQLAEFLNEFLNLYELENIIYYNNIKSSIDNDNQSNLVCKIPNKEIFIFIKETQSIDNNITYKMFEHSINIIKKWNKEEKKINIRYPIVIPIVIYTGKEIWNEMGKYNRLNYTTIYNNRINFSYNIVNIHDFNNEQLEKMNSKVAKKILEIKKKYLQIN